MKDGGQKNFKYAELDSDYFVPSGGGVALHYLVNLQKDLEERNNPFAI